MEFELGKLYSIKRELNIIPISSFSEANEFIHQVLREEYIDKLFRWSDIDSPWTKWKTEEGTWTKRFSSYLYKNYDIKLSPEALSRLGEILSRGLSKDETIRFEIAKYSDWNSGDFGEKSNSCWWGDYNSSRIGLTKDPRGYSILFYNSEEQFSTHSKKAGMGRCWLIVEKDYWVIFNAYGVPLSEIAIILSETFNLSQRKMKVLSNGSYINAGNLSNEGGMGGSTGWGHILGKAEAISWLKEPVDIGDIRAKDAVCSMCQKGSFRSDMYLPRINRSPDPVCRDCFENKIIRCESCFNFEQKDQITEAWNDGMDQKSGICRNCTTKTGNCEVHGRTIRKLPNIWHTSRSYCETCFRSGIVSNCSGCDHRVEKFGVVALPRHRRLTFCVPCLKKIKELEAVTYEA